MVVSVDNGPRSVPFCRGLQGLPKRATNRIYLFARHSTCALRPNVGRTDPSAPHRLTGWPTPRSHRSKGELCAGPSRHARLGHAMAKESAQRLSPEPGSCLQLAAWAASLGVPAFRVSLKMLVGLRQRIARAGTNVELHRDLGNTADDAIQAQRMSTDLRRAI
jgi:hypothetical protein